jgi:hypothetical protein
MGEGQKISPESPTSRVIAGIGKAKPLINADDADRKPQDL